LDRLRTNLNAYVTDADINTMMSWFGAHATDIAAARIGAIALARNYNLALYTGSSQVVEDSSAGFLNDAVVDDAGYSRASTEMVS
jgi:hypothetical protein